MQTLAQNLDEKQRTKDVILEQNVNFDSLLLPSDILKGLSASGFVKPSPIQFKAIPLGRCGFDLVIKSKSGTGKTLVFCTIALETINPTKQQLQVLILVPTREIAVQIQEVLRSISCHINGLVVESFIGGIPLDADIKKAKTCHIAVGAPGRVKHLLKLGALTPKYVRLFVMDEADKLMETSFQADINEIYNALPQRKQMIASSATYPASLDKFLANYMRSPTHVTSEHQSPLLLGLKQFVATLKPNLNSVQQNKVKNELLVDVLSKISFTQCLVFTNYQSRTETISNYLNQKGWSSCYISAAQEQTRRLEAVSNLKSFKNRILLTTDLTSRGIDAPNVDLVINYDLPSNAVTYLHRMGRAGRYGSAGVCINFALEGQELRRLQLILGSIGSTNLSIAKLPALNGRNDLLQVDESRLERVWGVVDGTTSTEEIKKEVLGLKHKVIEDDLEAPLADAQDVLAQDDSDSKKRKLETGEKQIKAELIRDQDNDKKATRDSASETFIKNRALLNTTKLLFDPNQIIDGDLVESVGQYLKNLKQISYSQVSTVEDVLPLSEDEVIEDIFRLAYTSASQKQERRSWMDYLSEREKKWFEESCQEVSASSSEEVDEEEDDNDVEMEVYAEREEEPEPNLEWVPVVPNCASTAPDEDHFVRCYEDCSNELWHNGLTHETVNDFDAWFCNWQEQVQAVRYYVQQNIYVEEMSKFQRSRLNNK